MKTIAEVRSFVNHVFTLIGLPPPRVRFEKNDRVQAIASYEPGGLIIVYVLPVSKAQIGHEIFHAVVDYHSAASLFLERSATVVGEEYIARRLARRKL
jgi:hypothetical protein